MRKQDERNDSSQCQQEAARDLPKKLPTLPAI
jgi:hypothetical protein